MKISEITGTQCIEKSTESSREIASTGSMDFQNILDEELDKSVALDKETGMVAGDMAAVTTLAPVITSTDASAVLEDDVRGMSGAVGLALDKIANAAGNKKQDLKEIEGVINSLSAEAEGWKDKLSELPESHGLRQIADELEVLAYVESVKWKRGDYL